MQKQQLAAPAASWWRNARGSSLVTVVSLSMLMGIGMIGYLQLCMTVAQNQRQDRRNDEAFLSAESGILLARHWLSLNETPASSVSDLFQNAPVNLNEKTAAANVLVDSTFLGKKTIRLQSIVDCSTLAYNKQLSVLVRRPTPFQWALLGDDQVTVTGNGSIDSYNSEHGPYDSSMANTNGNIGTNSSDSGAILLDGNGTIHGNASTGVDGSVIVGPNSTVTGDISDDCDQELPEVEIPPSLSGLPSSGVFQVTGNASLGNGDYHYSTIRVKGQGHLRITGEVRIYLSGSASFSVSGQGLLTIESWAELTLYTAGTCDIAGQGLANESGLPSRFSVYTNCAQTIGITVAGNGDFSGVIYAPEAGVLLAGNGDAFGAMIGKTVTVQGNGSIHYDEALGEMQTTFGPFAFVPGTWEEKNY